MEPLADVTTADKEVRVVIEMPGLSKDKIKVDAYEDRVEVKAEALQSHRCRSNRSLGKTIK
jgi:HSP20 family protein